MKFILKNQLMYKLIDTKLTYLLNQQEIQNTVKLSSFDTNGNYVLTLKNISEYYFEKLIQNNNFKAILNNFDMSYIFIFNNNNSLIKSPKINFSFNTNTPYSLYNITHISLTTNNGNRLFL